MQWITYGIEVEYCTTSNRSLTGAERANVNAVVNLMAATRREKDKELSDEVSHILQPGQAWDIPDDSLSETGLSNLPVSELPQEAKEGVQASEADHTEKGGGAPSAQPAKPINDGHETDDEWD